MTILIHVVTFACSIAIVWFFSGFLIESVGRMARRFNKTGFITAYFVLGFLTSISEISVAINSGIAGVPGVAVGNLIGASFVILLLIVPLLAVANKGISLTGSVSAPNLFLMLGLIVLPAVLVLDGNVTKTEGLLAVLAYATVAFVLYRARSTTPPKVVEERLDISGTFKDIGRILLSGLAIFLAAHFLVEQAVFMAMALSIPASLVGLVLLSLGTNLPEIVIAVRSVIHRRTDIAFGDYLGSSTMNTLVFGGVALASGTFLLESSEFIVTALLMIAGLLCLYFFARSKCTLSRMEGIVLLLFYAAFIAIQIANIAKFATD